MELYKILYYGATSQFSNLDFDQEQDQFWNWVQFIISVLNL
jgi:hypothetical protein